MKHFLIACIILVTQNVNAQGAFFSQYNFSKTFTNPAFAGSDSTLNIAAGVRTPWPTIKNGNKIVTFSADNYFRFLRGGLGFNVLNENNNNGAFNSTDIMLMYAPHVELFNHKLVIKPAVQLGYFRHSINWGKLGITDSTGAVKYNNGVPLTSFKSGLDLSTGIVIYTSKFYGGVALHHITEPDEGITQPSKMPKKFTLHGGANIDVTKKFSITPTILFMKMQDYTTLLPGVTARYKCASTGVAYNINNDAIIVSASFQNRVFKIGYAYDSVISRLTNSRSGTHELQLAWLLHHKKTCKIKTIRLL